MIMTLFPLVSDFDLFRAKKIKMYPHYSLTLLEFSITTKLIFYLVLETDRPDPKLQNAEIKYVPEQM